MFGRVLARVNRHVSVRAHERAYATIATFIYARVCRGVYRRVDGINGFMKLTMYEWMDRWMEGCRDQGMEGWREMDGWDGRVGGWINERMHACMDEKGWMMCG